MMEQLDNVLRAIIDHLEQALQVNLLVLQELIILNLEEHRLLNDFLDLQDIIVLQVPQLIMIQLKHVV